MFQLPDFMHCQMLQKMKNLEVKGSSLAGLTIEVYLNGQKTGEVKTDESGEFKYNVTLTEGDNIIKSRAVKNGSKSDFSNSENIKLRISGPELNNRIS